MSEDKKEIFSVEGGDKEPVTYQCNGCQCWSAYKSPPEGMPRGWRENEKGYFCNNCRTDKKRN